MNLTNITELCDIQIGRTPKRSEDKYWGEGHNWLSIADMDSKYVFASKEQVTDLAVDECRMKIVPQNTVVMSFKLTIGRIGITDKELYTNEAIAAFLIKDKNLLLPEYLYYSLKGYNFDHLIDRAAKGKTLNKRKLSEIYIPLLSIDKQKKIIDILNKAENLLGKRQQQIEALLALKKSIFLETFGNPAHNTKGWEMKSIDELFEIEDGDRGKAYPKQEDLQSEGILFLSTSNIKKNSFVLNEKKYISYEKFDELRKGKLKKGDIILTLRGTIGNIALFDNPNYDTGFINAQMAILRSKGINETFFCELYSIDLFTEHLQRYQSGSSQRQLPLRSLKKIKIIAPPINVQRDFEIKTKQIDTTILSLKDSLQELSILYDSLLNKAFSGELFKEEIKA